MHLPIHPSFSFLENLATNNLRYFSDKIQPVLHKNSLKAKIENVICVRPYRFLDKDKIK
jgi:hypothetical protein